MKEKEKQASMLSLVVSWRASGLTRRSFCELHGIKFTALKYWISQSRTQKQGDGGFITIEREEVKKGGIELIYPNGVVVKTNGSTVAAAGAYPSVLICFRWVPGTVSTYIRATVEYAQVL